MAKTWDSPRGVELRRQYCDLGQLWYAWLRGREGRTFAAARLTQLLGRTVPVEDVERVHEEALLDTVQELFELNAVTTAWLLDVTFRGELPRSKVEELMKNAHPPRPQSVKDKWRQTAVLQDTRNDVARLARTGSRDEADKLAASARTFLRRWVLTTIPQAPSERDLRAIPARHHEAYGRAWTAARQQLLKEVRALTVPEES